MLQFVMDDASGSRKRFRELLRNSGNDFVRINCFGDVTGNKKLSCDRGVVFAKSINNSCR
jgi:hypothetical protein